MRRYRFACMLVEGEGSKMRVTEIGSKPTQRSAHTYLEEVRKEEGLSRKRVGIFDRRGKRWVDMPWVLHTSR